MRAAVNPLLCVFLVLICPFQLVSGQEYSGKVFIERLSLDGQAQEEQRSWDLVGPLLVATRWTAGSEKVALISTNTPPGTAGRLHASLLLAKEELNIDRLPKLDQARVQLEQALQSLEQFIHVGTENGDNWSKFLRLSELREQIGSQRPAYPRLLELEMNMRQNYLGLEYAAFTRLREALGGFVAASRFYTQEEAFLRTLRQSLDDAIQELEQPEVDSAKVDSLVVGILSNLHQANQAPEARQNLRSLYSQPNLRVVINGRSIDWWLARLPSLRMSMSAYWEPEYWGRHFLMDRYRQTCCPWPMASV